MKKTIGRILASVLFAGFVGFTVGSPLFAQLSFGGQPKSFTMPAKTQSFRVGEVQEKVVNIKFTQNVDDIIAAADWKSQNQWGGSLYITSAKINTDIDFARDAQQVLLADGSFVYRLSVKSEGAKGLYPTYSKFSVPQGARLFVYNADRSEVLGAFSYETNPTGREFASMPVSGDEIVFEYEPNVAGEVPEVVIDGIMYMFRSAPRPQELPQDMGEDRSDPSCQINANCSQGDAWNDQKAGIVQIYIVQAGYGGVCSGNLMNNTREDYAPYILSAAHCASTTAAFGVRQDELNRWMFSFHYMKPSCSNSEIGSMVAQTVVGCTKVAFLPIVGYSDGLLLRLNQDVPAQYRVYYNGWDRTSSAPPSGVGLHHPGGDAMKISVLNTTPQNATWNAQEKGYPNAHFILNFSEGDTEGGSSGSSLFNPQKLVVGTLTGGGGAKCTTSARDYYGRLSFHWDKFKTEGDDKRMDIYLDPTNSGKDRLEGRFRDGMRPLYPVVKMVAVPVAYSLRKIHVKWNSPVNADNAGVNIVYDIRRGGKLIAEGIKHVNGQTENVYIDEIQDEDINKGMVRYQVRARYQLDPTVTTAWTSPIGVYLGGAPTTVEPTKVEVTSGKTMIMWSRPAVHQEWSKIGYSESFQYQPVPTFAYPKSPYQRALQPYVQYREKWPMGILPEEVNGKRIRMYVSQVNVMPVKAGTDIYIYLSYDKNLNRPNVFQKVTVPANWTPGQWLSVPLNTPFEIVSSQMLYAGFGAANNGISVPARIAYVNGSSDGLSKFSSSRFLIKDNSNGYGGYEDDWVALDQVRNNAPFGNNYLAMRLVISNDSKALPAPVSNIAYGGTEPSVLPLVNTFIVKRDGVEVGRTVDPFFVDPNNPDASGKYTIDVVYEDLATGDTSVDVPRADITVYPTTFVDRIHVRNASLVKAATLYTADGTLAKHWIQPLGEMLDLSDVSSGSYLLRLETTTDPMTIKLIKR